MCVKSEREVFLEKAFYSCVCVKLLAALHTLHTRGFLMRAVRLRIQILRCFEGLGFRPK